MLEVGFAMLHVAAAAAAAAAAAGCLWLFVAGCWWLTHSIMADAKKDVSGWHKEKRRLFSFK